jgi:hypothetical protein
MNTLGQIESTYVCQLNKPENRKVLEGYRDRRDGSGRELANYYRDLVMMLQGTPAWNVSGVNKMLNELTDQVRATLNHAKKGKTSAYARARALLYKIDSFKDQEAPPQKPGAWYRKTDWLQPLVTPEELQALAELN